MWFIGFFILFVGCANMPQLQNPSDVGAGAVIGAGAHQSD